MLTPGAALLCAGVAGWDVRPAPPVWRGQLPACACRLCGYAHTGGKEHVTRNDQTSVGEHARCRVHEHTRLRHGLAPGRAGPAAVGSSHPNSQERSALYVRPPSWPRIERRRAAVQGQAVCGVQGTASPEAKVVRDSEGGQPCLRAPRAVPAPSTRRVGLGHPPRFENF